jgi:low affinity Fe/Cu permease
MKISITTIIIIAVTISILLVIFIKKNRRDKKELEEKLNQDYRKPGQDDYTDIEDDKI